MGVSENKHAHCPQRSCIIADGIARMKAEVLYIRKWRDNGSHSYEILAVGDIWLPDLGLRVSGVHLVKHAEGILGVYAPSAKVESRYTVWWPANSAIERAALAALLPAYEEMLARDVVACI
ncbi:hypothetical protein QA648_34135 (plasmid) [Rhizobium sp. CB3171]|uniref:hypothetical protein n=1 Tax=Rhizobium sp. CB3171 TaxID=3039157 RepID=UPI0024B0954B|nr:hypothetical protein [Rhizobium sp. CB3171]WFU06819.1 hypothetical protein QA648_34135 [Rhizobium sp. CB3171]